MPLDYIFQRRLMLALCLACALSFLIPQPAMALEATQYDELFPNYLEACTVSQEKGRNKPPGRTWGHMVLYIKGACRKKSTAYPQVELCDKNTLADADSGVLLSVDSLLENVNWIATEGKSLGFFGLLTPSENLDQAQVQRVTDQVMRDQIFKGIAIHTENGAKIDERTKNVVMAQNAVGIDYALTFGRNVYCARMPIEDFLLTKVIRYLNTLNERYYNGDVFDWTPLYNNCAHLVHNTLADIGLWNKKLVDQHFWYLLANLAVPANEFINIMETANLTSLNDPVWLYKRPELRQTLLTYDWIPMRHGVVSETFEAHQPNSLYDTRNLKLSILEWPGSHKEKDLFSRFTHAPEFTDLHTNLVFYKAKYEEAIKVKKPVAFYEKKLGLTQKADFEEFYYRYYNYLQNQVIDVQKKISALEALKSF